MPWPRAGAAGAVKEAIWNARALACNVTRSLECQTRANFFSDTFAVRATDGCTMPCYVYTFIHQFSLSIFDRATTLVIFIVTNDQHHCLMSFFFFSLSCYRLFFFRKLIYETRNIFFSYLAKYRSVRDKFISLRADISRKRDKSIYVERNKRETFELDLNEWILLRGIIESFASRRWKDGWKIGETKESKRGGDVNGR